MTSEAEKEYCTCAALYAGECACEYDWYKEEREKDKAIRVLREALEEIRACSEGMSLETYSDEHYLKTATKALSETAKFEADEKN